MAFQVVIDERPADVLVPRVVALAHDAVAARGRFSIALPGGSVATTCFPRLAEAAIDWGRVHFFWADERAVPPTHEESNYGACERLWLERIVAHAPVVHRMEAEHADLDDAVARYERAVRANGPIDLVLLGMGPDGHVASLFPGHGLLEEKERGVAAVLDSPKPPPRRMTLTLPVICAARDVIVVATGAAKAGAVRAIRDDPASRLPAALALRGAPRAMLIVDPAAAG